MFLFQFKNPLILLLLASALVSVLTREYEDAVSIAVVSVRTAPCRDSAPLPDPLPRACRVSAYLCYARKQEFGYRFKKKRRRRRKGKTHPSVPPGVSWSLGHSSLGRYPGGCWVFADGTKVAVNCFPPTPGWHRWLLAVHAGQRGITVVVVQREALAISEKSVIRVKKHVKMSHFKVNTFTAVCHHHPWLVPECFHCPKRRPHTHYTVAPHPHPPAPGNQVCFLRTDLFWTFHIYGPI